MVGWALNQTKLQVPFFPAHRVVNRAGLLTGKKHFGGTETMAELLKSEGVQVVDNKIVDMETRFWDPTSELPPQSVWLDDEK
jgi:methylated-DNA-protein-cysteine methyltransferase-like protein